MRTTKLTSNQRRRLRELADPIERITQGDLNYFARFPHRRHRVREADCAEIEQAELLGIGVTLHPGNRHYCAIRYVSADTCLRLAVGGPAHVDPESLDEEMARAIFECAAPLMVCLQGDLTHAEMLAIIKALK